MVDVLIIVLVNLLDLRAFQQVIAMVHQFTQRVQRAYNLLHIGDNGFVFVLRKRSHIMWSNLVIDAELDFFRVNENEFQFIGVFLIEQRGDNGVQTDRLSLTSSTGYKQVGELGQVNHEHFICDGFAKGHRQSHFRCLKFAGVQCAFHRHNLWLLVRNLNTNGALPRDRSDDSYAQGRQAKGYIGLQTTYATDSDALGRGNLIQGYGGAYSCIDSTDFYAKAVQDLNNARVVRLDFLHVDDGLRVIFPQQVERRKAIFLKRCPGIDRHVKVNVRHRHL